MHTWNKYENKKEKHGRDAELRTGECMESALCMSSRGSKAVLRNDLLLLYNPSSLLSFKLVSFSSILGNCFSHKSKHQNL